MGGWLTVGVKGFYKVPFRSVLAPTIGSWLRATIWCHFVIRLWPHARDLGSDALLRHYINRPATFFEQYESCIRAAYAEQTKTPVTTNSTPINDAVTGS